MFGSIWKRSSKNNKRVKEKRNSNVAMWFNEKKKQFPRFWSFRFCPVLKIENSEISKSLILLKCLAVYETQNRKNYLKERPLTLRCSLRKKMSIFEVSKFSILPYTWNRKFGNLEKFLFTSIFYRFRCIKHGKD